MPQGRMVEIDSLILRLINDGYLALEHKYLPVKPGSMDVEVIPDDASFFIKKLRKAEAYFSVALDLAETYQLKTETLDTIVKEFIGHAQKGPSLFWSISVPNPNIVVRFAVLGASREVSESLLMLLAKNGYRRLCVDLAKALNRLLSKEEIEALVEDYNNGAGRSDEEERELGVLIRNCLPQDDANELITSIWESRRVFDTSIE